VRDRTARLLILLAAIVVGTALVAGWHAWRIDRCLDAGGRWSAAEWRCERG
jgi:hypothetical protein